MQIYVRNINCLIEARKKAYILKHFNGQNHKELAIATGYNERWVYEMLKHSQDDRQPRLF